MERPFFQFDKYNKFDYILRFTFNPTRVCVHRNILNEFLFDENIPGLEDIDLWLHIATKYPVFQIIEITNIYNFHEGTYSLGDYDRFVKELKNFKYIFNKPELKPYLRIKEKNRLLSMCHFHLSKRYEKENKIKDMYSSIIQSFFLYPPGYNGKTNKILLAMFLYHIPAIGSLLKYIKK